MMSESPRRPFELIFLASFISLVVATSCRGSSQDINSFLLNWTQAGNDVYFVCCGGAWDPHDIKWQKSIAVKGTRWCAGLRNLTALFEQVKVRGAPTYFMMYRHRGTPGHCVDAVAEFYSVFYSTKLIVFGHFDACQASAELLSSQRKTLCICCVSPPLGKYVTAIKGVNRSGMCAQSGTDHFLKYDREKISPRSLLSFSGKRVAVGCKLSHMTSHKRTACNNPRSKLFLEGLTRLNATLVKAVFPPRDHLQHYFAKQIDVHMYLRSVRFESLSFFDVALVTDLNCILFYVKKSGTKPVNVGYILQESKLCLYFLTLCLVLCFVVLLVADSVDPATTSMTVANDIMLFLVATFYATSCDMPATVRCCTSRRFVILAWVLGSFSLSVYFRGQITSWLIARTPEYIVDDLIKLETALDDNAILPCVTENSHVYMKRITNGTELQSKIKKSIGSHTKDTVKTNVIECLKCATNKSRFCVIWRQTECLLKTIRLGVTESKEPILVAYSGVLVRKNYNLRMAFRSLLLRIFETNWPHLSDVECLARHEKHIIEPISESLQLQMVAQFMLPCFCMSVAVFLLEVLLGRYFIQRAGRLTGVRVA